MAVTVVAFLVAFAFCVIAGLVNPTIALAGYMAIYMIAPDDVWWGRMIRHWGIRYSMIMGLVLALSLALNWRRTKLGGTMFATLDKLFILFLVWAAVVTYVFASHYGTSSAYGMEKLFKLTLFLLMMTHWATTPSRFRVAVWVIALGGMLFGWRALGASASAFSDGRLNSLGGPDYGSANQFALQMCVSMVFAGILFLKSRLWVKVFLAFGAALITNAVIMCRGRGAFIGIACGVVAAFIMSPKALRKRLIVGVMVGIAGFVYLTDDKYWDRMSFVKDDQQLEKDTSAQDRIDTWRAGLQMFSDHPLGVGRGNFGHHLGTYLPRLAGRDSHNTFVRALCELGIIGFLLFAAVIGRSFQVLIRARKLARRGPEGEDIAWFAYALIVAMVIYLTGGFFSTVLYIEGFWWLFAMACCVERMRENLLAERLEENAGTDRKTAPAKRELAFTGAE